MRHSIGNGFGSAVGDDDDGEVDLGEEAGGEIALMGYECLLSEWDEICLTGQSLRTDCSR